MATSEYDVVVVGSGATGGWAAKELCEAGFEVVMVEAGRELDPVKDYSEHVQRHDLALRGRGEVEKLAERRPVGSKNYAFSETNAHFFIDEIDNPYVTPKDKPFWWVRSNMVGGRTILWGRQSYRLSDYDFKAASRDGYGQDWPISYAELDPYYTKVERWIGVSGEREGYDVLPDGYFLPPMAMNCGELKMKDAIRKMGRGFTIGRVAVNTRAHHGRAACHYCGPCHRGCITNAYFNSPGSTLPAADATGKFSLITNAIVRSVEMNSKGLASGVVYTDKVTGETREITAKSVVLCASTLESTRILFNSATSDFPDGLGNSSGVLGKYIMDHIYAVGAGGKMPGNTRKPEAGVRPNACYIPRFANIKNPHEKDFIRGYGYQGGTGITSYEHAYARKGFGKSFKDGVRDGNEERVRLSGFGEMLPREENRCYIDSDKVDKWGIPALRVEVTLGENEEKMIQDIVKESVTMLEASGATDIKTDYDPGPPGFGIHEVGTARMGDDPKTSFLNKWNQSHQIKNLFVMDGSCFVSIACQNPTLTMMALTVRGCEHLVAEAKRGNLV